MMNFDSDEKALRYAMQEKKANESPCSHYSELSSLLWLSAVLFETIPSKVCLFVFLQY